MRHPTRAKAVKTKLLFRWTHCFKLLRDQLSCRAVIQLVVRNMFVVTTTFIFLKNRAASKFGMKQKSLSHSYWEFVTSEIKMVPFVELIIFPFFQKVST